MVSNLHREESEMDKEMERSLKIIGYLYDRGMSLSDAVRAIKEWSGGRSGTLDKIKGLV